MLCQESVRGRDSGGPKRRSAARRVRGNIIARGSDSDVNSLFRPVFDVVTAHLRLLSESVSCPQLLHQGPVKQAQASLAADLFHRFSLPYPLLDPLLEYSIVLLW